MKLCSVYEGNSQLVISLTNFYATTDFDNCYYNLDTQERQFRNNQYVTVGPAA